MRDSDVKEHWEQRWVAVQKGGGFGGRRLRAASRVIHIGSLQPATPAFVYPTHPIHKAQRLQITLERKLKLNCKKVLFRNRTCIGRYI